MEKELIKMSQSATDYVNRINLIVSISLEKYHYIEGLMN
jgi:hypothetical protein